MATFNPRRFSKPEALKTLEPGHLLRLLAPHQGFLERRGLALPFGRPHAEIDFPRLSAILMTPEADTPEALVEALYFINEMATVHGMDQILPAAKARHLLAANEPEPTPADVALRLWLDDPEALKAYHAQQFLIRPRSFEYFRATTHQVPDFNEPDAKTLHRLEETLGEWFEKKGRGSVCRVQCFSQDQEAWFLILHGEPYRREGSLEQGEPASVFFRPEKADVLVYNQEKGELWANARSKAEKELYGKKIGEMLFDDPDLFTDREKFTLEPLRRDGEASLVCHDVDGLEWAKLREIQYRHQGVRTTRLSSNLFGVYRLQGLPDPEAKIEKAKFQVKFTDAKAPRIVTLQLPNRAQYTRDSDSILVERWLERRGFIQPRPGLKAVA